MFRKIYCRKWCESKYASLHSFRLGLKKSGTCSQRRNGFFCHSLKKSETHFAKFKTQNVPLPAYKNFKAAQSENSAYDDHTSSLHEKEKGENRLAAADENRYKN
jgi:hypothetical protein